MRFAFTADQVAFRQQLRAMLADRCRPADVREAWRSARGWSEERWSDLAELGVTGLSVPAAHGGLGLGPVHLVGLLEELGWAAAPEPVAETTALAVPLLADLADAGSAEAAATLRGVAEGSVVAAVAVPAGGGLALTPATADVVVALGGDGVRLVRPAPGAVTGRRSLDGSYRPGSLALTAAASAPLVSAAADMAATTADRAATALGAVLVGLAGRMLALAADYARERRQFGHAVGSFQAVKHRLADVAVRLEHTRPAVYRAAWSLETGQPTAGRDASMAKAMASDAALEAARAALQVHGAIGYTWEHDLHLWMKRVWVLAPAWGDGAWHRARVLDALTRPGVPTPR